MTSGRSRGPCLQIKKASRTEGWRSHDHIGQLISTIARMSRVRFDRLARELGLTRAQWRTLNCLRYNDGINQSRLAELLEVEHVTVTRMVDTLVELGWVERRPDPNDRRSRTLHLTSKVEPVLKGLRQISEIVVNECNAGLSARDLAALGKMLTMVRDNLTRVESRTEVQPVLAGRRAAATPRSPSP